MIVSIYAALTSFVIALILLPLIIRFSEKRKLFAAPGGRRIHKKETPSMGGVAIFAGFIAAVMLWMDPAEPKSRMLILTVIAIPFIIGLLDDLLHLGPAMKMLGQFVAATLIFFMLDLKLRSFYELIPAAGELPELVSYFITVFFIIIVTNSFNLIDGIDGLAATIALIALLFFGIWFYFAGNTHYVMLCFGLSGGILAFLFLNWEPSKIFMGDTGSLIIGMILSVLAIEFMNVNSTLSDASPVKFRGSIGSAACVLVVPLSDTIRVVIIRISKGISPLSPDKRHIHHTLVRIGNSHRMAVSVLCVTHILFITGAILLRSYSDPFVLFAAAAGATLLCVLLDRMTARATLSRKSN